MNNLVKIDVSFEYQPKVYPYKRSSGWYWKFKLPNGKFFTGKAPGSDEKTVKRNATKKERELSKGLFTQKEIKKIQETSSTITTFESAITQYIEYLILEGASPNYFLKLKNDLTTISKTFKEKYKVDQIHKLTEEHAYSFRNHLLRRVKKDELKKVTAFRLLNDVKRLFKWLKRRKKIRTNPWLEIEAISVPKESRARSEAPSQEVITKLLLSEYEHPFKFPIKEFAYGLFRTGARMEELLYLELDDVDWESGLWTIKPKQCPNKHGTHWSPKYGKARKAIIPQDVLNLLKPLVTRVNQFKVVGYTPDENGNMVPKEAKFLFTMLDKKLSKDEGLEVYRRVDRIDKAWKNLFTSVGLFQSVSINGSEKIVIPFTRHDMRRGFNLAAKNAGMSLDDRALILGHGRTVNENHYCGKAELNTGVVQKLISSFSGDEKILEKVG